MSLRTCSSGTKWDSLINKCMPTHYLQPPKPTTSNLPVQPPVLHQTTIAPAEYIPVINVSVWICVAIVMGGSILVVLLFVIIYRWHASHSLSTEDKEAKPCDPAAMPTAVGAPAEVVVNGDPNSSSSCSHQTGGMGVQCQEEGTWRDAGGFSSPHMYNGRTEGGIPLPATELGGAALVTTKTVQCSY